AEGGEPSPQPGDAGQAANGRPHGWHERAWRYIDKVPRAVAGEHGHDQTFKVACRLVEFGLSDAEALPLFTRWNESCQPPWEEKDLGRKLSEARKKTGPDKAFTGNGKAHSSERKATGGPAPELPMPVPASALERGTAAPWLWRGYLSRGGITLLSA